MNQKITIFYQTPWSWEFLWNRAQPLAKALSKHAKVYYIDGGCTKAAFFKIRHRFNWLLKQVVIDDNLVNLKILSSHTNHFSVVHGYNSIYSKKILDFVLKEKKRGKKVWLLTSRPQIASIIKSNLWDKIIVDIEDPWMDLNWYNMLPNINSLVEDLFKASHKVFANGNKIANTFEQQYKKEVIALSNGINEEFLKENIQHKFDLPNNDKFVVTFVGNINDRLDYSLLEKIIYKFPKAIFKFAGKELLDTEKKDIWDRIKKARNFIYLGEVPHKEIRNIIKSSNALLLPYADAGSKLMFPAKLLEYLSAHKPILSTVDFSSDLGGRLNQIICFSNYEEIESKIQALISGDLFFSAEDYLKADEILKNSTWDKKAELFMSHCLK